jgi:hypothetical protein
VRSPRSSLIPLVAVLLLSGALPRWGRAGAGTASDAAAPPFEFGLFGNQQATPEAQARFPSLVAAMNRAGPAFSVHDGGIGTAPQDCSDDYVLETRDAFDRFAAPLVYTPGAPEWSDCGDGDEPLERLGSLRRTFFATGSSQGRRTLDLERQRPYYPENARWVYGSVTFATLHVIGGGDGLGRGAQTDREAAARQAATAAWLNAAFDQAERSGSAGVVLIWQADPRFGEDVPAYNDIRATLRARTVAFGRPVVLVHGDSGYFRIDKPMVDERGRRVPNFTRVETFGGADVHWVRAMVDPSDPGLFTFRPEIVEPASEEAR